MKLTIRIVLLVIMGMLVTAYLHAQAPVIQSIHKYIGTSGEKVTLAGSNFGTSAANLSVHFGAAKVTILTVADQLIEATVPAGTTFENITVTNIANGLTGYSNDQFLLSYGGEHPFDVTKMSGQLDFPAAKGLYDLCIVDLDGDGKNDIASVNDDASSNTIIISLNTGTVGSPNFVKYATTVNSRTLHIRSGDLNGDGKQDLIMSEGGSNGNRIFVIKNTSTPGSLSFSTLQIFTLTGANPKRIEVADLDSDGRPELIMTDQGAGKITVLPNTSTLTTISFATHQTFIIAGATNTDGLAVEDLNGDHLPDIILNQILLPNVFVLKNNSSPGNIKLENQITLNVTGNLVNVRVGDLDGDDKPDIAVTRWLSSGISVFLNQTTNGKIQFSSPNNIITESEPWGIDFGDLDGDMKNDIIVSSVLKTITILNNESTTGNLSFQKSAVPTTYKNRHVKVGDLDGDSKPDIVFTSIDDINLGIDASEISVIRNKNCLVPLIDRSGPLTICSGSTIRLTVNQSTGVTYDWKIDGVSTGGTNYFYDATATSPGNYTVTATSEAGACIKTSNTIIVASGGAATVGNPVYTPSSPKVCMGADLSLGITSTNADEFDWTGPNGFSYTGNPLIINNFKAEYAGKYNVNIKKGTGASACIAKQDFVVIEGINMPEFKVGFAGADVICSSDTKVLSVSPSPPSGFTYQWFETTAGPIAGEIASSYTASQSGEYYYQAQSTIYPSCPTISSSKSKITVVTTPVVAFNSPTEACKSSSVQFINQSTTDPSSPASYTWNFGDGQFSTSESPTHLFTSVQTFNVKLSITYANGTCPAELTKTIKISDAPAASITTPGSVSTICEGDALKLEVSLPFTTYAWSTTEATPAITISKSGIYTVDVTNAVGCKFTLTKTINALPAPQITIEAQPNQVTSGESVQLNASGLVSYDWDPGKLVSDSTIANPLSLPLQTTLFTVTGKSANGCAGQGSVEVKVKGESAASKLKPSNFFSPNGDAVNNVWSVDNILTFPQCSVTIYDDKGIKLYEAKPYMNDWDGSFQGKLLPNGVYFYIIRCDGEEDKPKAGSITLIR